MEYYERALKNGKRQFQKDVFQGYSGYLPALDTILKNTDIVTEVSLGTLEIPLNKIVGTKTILRSNTFAKNFMPLLDRNGEFANKWNSVCEAHLQEGIRDPVIAYEYLNKFYVQEGNKRVSVLKFFDAFSIEAKVIRLIPKKDEQNPINRIYYEFLDFYEETKINYIWFTKENSFNEILEYIKDLNLINRSYSFKSIYYSFRTIYKSIGGDELSITTGDALLEFLRIYQEWEDVDEKILIKRIKNIWGELELASSKEPIVRKTDLEDIVSKNIITNIAALGVKKKKLKVAFIYNKKINESAWVYGHELGRLHVENVFEELIETTYIEDISDIKDVYLCIEKLVEDKNDIIITTSPRLVNVTIKAALEFPQTKFLNCSANISYKGLKTFYGRMYEAKFLSGIIAGAMTKSDKIGYIESFPVYETINSLNAFALGAKLINPYAKVKVHWSNTYKEAEIPKEVNNELINWGADIISSQIELLPNRGNEEYGLFLIKDKKYQNLATTLWNWGIFYEKVFQSILNGTWSAVTQLFDTETRAINYWWGLDSGVVDLIYSKSLLPKDTQKMVEFMKKMIIYKTFNPFAGPIYDQNGELKIEENQILNSESIVTMDWFVQGIEGDLRLQDSVSKI